METEGERTLVRFMCEKLPLPWLGERVSVEWRINVDLTQPLSSICCIVDCSLGSRVWSQSQLCVFHHFSFRMFALFPLSASQRSLLNAQCSMRESGFNKKCMDAVKTILAYVMLPRATWLSWSLYSYFSSFFSSRRIRIEIGIQKQIRIRLPLPMFSVVERS